MSNVTVDDLATLDIPARVARGAKLLDRVRPGWWREINEEELQVCHCYKCILGQVYGDYRKACHLLKAEPDFGAVSCGFDFPNLVMSVHWAALADAWRAEIARRADAVTREVTV